MIIFILLALFYIAPIQTVIKDPESNTGEHSDFLDDSSLPIVQPYIAVRDADADTDTEGPQGHYMASTYQQQPYSYEQALWVSGSFFLFAYGYFRALMYISEWALRSTIHMHKAILESNFPRAMAWINQEMERNGFKKEEYSLLINDFNADWRMPYQTKKPYVITVPRGDLAVIECLLIPSANNSNLDRYRCALHIICSQLSPHFISQYSANTKSCTLWGAVSAASLIASLFFLWDKNIKRTDLFDDLVHAALPCIALYQLYTSIRRLNNTETHPINHALDTLPVELIPACIEFFERKKKIQASTTWYDCYIQRLKERLSKNKEETP